MRVGGTLTVVPHPPTHPPPPPPSQLLMHSIALRRTKGMLVNGRPLVQLPSKTVHIVKVQLSKGERQKYDRWAQGSMQVWEGGGGQGAAAEQGQYIAFCRQTDTEE